MPSPTLTVIVGLPGSGKSALIRSEFPAGSVAKCVEDFHERSLDNSHTVTSSQYYREVLGHLRGGRDCVIADIAFTDASQREAIRCAFQADVPGVVISWIYFKNDPRQCMTNVLGDTSRGDWLARAGGIVHWSPRYSYPDGADIRPVYAACHIVDSDSPPPS
jgi:hypothetical protein